MNTRFTRSLILFVFVGLLAMAYLYTQNAQQVNNPQSLVMQTLKAQSFTDMQVDWTPAGLVCDESGEQGYAFVALTSAGEPVSGIVCVRFSPTRYAYIRYR